MIRRKKHIGKSDSEIENLRIDEERAKDLSRQSNGLEIDRKSFVENILEISNIIDNQIEKETEQSKIYDFSRGKNILQSLVYLILNPIFYQEIGKIRKKLNIPQFGFEGEAEYKKWAKEFSKRHDMYYQKRKLHRSISDYDDTLCSFGYNKVFQEAEWLVKNYKLAYKKDVPRLTFVVYVFLTQRLDFESFFNKVGSVIYEDHNNFFVGEFDVKKRELPMSEGFYKTEWKVKLYPFIKKTGLGDKLKDFFETEVFCQQNEKFYDKEHIMWQMKQAGIKNRQKSDPELQIIDGKEMVLLQFTTDFFTKPSQIMNLYKKRKPEIDCLLEQKEEKFKKVQKKRLSMNFNRNYRIYEYILNRKEESLQEIYENIFGESEDISKEEEERKFNVIKGELGEFQANIRDAIKRKIDL